MAPVDTKQKYMQKTVRQYNVPDENKQSYVTLSGMHTITMDVISSYIEQCYHNSLHYLLPAQEDFFTNDRSYFTPKTQF